MAGPPAVDSALMLRLLCHELRTPVTTLTALTRALADDDHPLPDATRRAAARLAYDQAVHLEGLVRKAAAGSGAPTAGGRPADHVVPLAEILAGVSLLVPAHRRSTHVTRRAAACPVPARRARQVFGNLVENALRHGPPDGAVGIHAELWRGELSVLVTDEGRVDRSLTAALRRRTPGEGPSGLGLWLVRRLVAVDGGRIRLHRLRPYGVALEVLLPRTGPRA
ncbi:HAMP domain-containing sensor histidine kinase [Micromonospora sp. WMMD882]|uniref:sensor histidine kinase n=1 Tax=Micromonospora sp. WMMD882 TaxID=3015151 RepID=UPI00248CC979|nr:HAMP domain-containing sensor histidine kinase [Micromonospora sp. WMMD882]WBB78093.1 HAMP domain-containing sensor histidine kinase [Micromonospora sp. WMMD882]